MNIPSHADLETAIAAYKQGRNADAIEILQRITSSTKATASSWYLLGLIQFADKQNQPALEALNQCVMLEDAHSDAWALIGRIHYTNNQIEESIAAFRKAYSITPNPAILESISHASLKCAQQFEAAYDYQRAAHLLQELIDLGSRDPGVYRRLAQCYQFIGQTARAREVYDRLLAFHPSVDNQLGKWVGIDIVKPDSKTVDAHFDATILALDKLLEQPSSSHEGLPSKFILSGLYYFSYHYRDTAALKKKIAEVLKRHYPALQFEAEHCKHYQKPHARRIRIGFVSNLFRKHTIGRLNIGLLEQLDKTIFEVFVFSNTAHSDQMAERFRNAADHTCIIPKNLIEARQYIADQCLDILCFSDIGMDPFLYFLSFSRLAPKQCVFWGHPETTGVATLDYFISSESIEPENAQSHYTESLVRLSRLPMYYEMPALTQPIPTRSELGIPDSKHLYLCPQTLYKLHPDFDSILAGILQRDPNGIIGLIEGVQPTIKQQFEERFQKKYPELLPRIHWIAYIPTRAFLALLMHADVMLDPLYFGGGNSTFEALALGCPIVTWPAAFMRGRITSGCYAQMGISGLTVHSAEEYIAKACEIGTSKALRGRLGEEILARNHHILRDASAVRELEEFFKQI